MWTSVGLAMVASVGGMTLVGTDVMDCVSSEQNAAATRSLTSSGASQPLPLMSRLVVAAVPPQVASSQLWQTQEHDEKKDAAKPPQKRKARKAACPVEIRGIIQGTGTAFAIVASGERSELLAPGEGARLPVGWVAVVSIAKNSVLLRFGEATVRCPLIEKLR